VPIELLDVAGLVPGAHEGKGLGNKFLDDLRHADALVHVVDVSGTTDAEGKETRGYDPSQDIVWLRSEIVQWIRGNLMQKWGSIKRRHIAVKATAVETLQGQFSGYGSTAVVVARTLDKLALKEPLEHWSDETIDKVVNAFTDEKFPTVFALNKIDHPDADKNISKIAKVLSSSLSPPTPLFPNLRKNQADSTLPIRCRTPRLLFYAPLSQKCFSES
jgi:ribosome-binding ATPase YchF (GTP1/OBG family)